MDAAAELGRNPVSKQQIQPEHGDEQTDAGRDGRTRLARPNSQARTDTDREIFIFPIHLTTSKIGNFTRLIHTLAIALICVTIRTVCVFCVFFPFILDIKFVGRSSRRGHTGGRSHRIFHPPSFCGACLNFSPDKDSAIIPFTRRP